MFEYIILDDEDDVIMVEKEADPPQQQQQQAKKSTKFEKRLIAAVRPRLILYDSKHKHFANTEKKDLVWEKIANKLEMDVDVCKNTWIELRLKFQKYTRRMRSFFLHPQAKKRKRPTMKFENDLVFLWRCVEDAVYCPIPYEIEEPSIEGENTQETEPAINVDDDLILIEQPVELIVIDEDDDAKAPEKIFHITSIMKTLVSHVKKYPELFDINDPLFGDYSRKSFVWNTIANQMVDKATKLMKCWIIMETRFEWEISKTPKAGEGRIVTGLEKMMSYFQPFILANPNTVYKYSYYLKQAWYDPIDYFKDLYNLISRMKRLPDIVYLTDSQLKKPEKNQQYFTMWAEMAESRNWTVGQCEMTWLIMHHFYWELMNMRKQTYHLTDKWYFEIIITELYDVVKDCKLAKQEKKAKETKEQQVKTYSNKTILNGNLNIGSPMPMVVLHNQAIQQPKTIQTPPAKAINQTTTPGSQQGPLPVISSAVSLAPKPVPGSTTTGAPVQIRPLVGKTAQNVVLPPKATPASNQIFTNNVQSPAPQVNMVRTQLANIASPVAKASLAPNTNANNIQRVASAEKPTNVTITQKRTKVNLNTSTQSTTSAVVNLTNGADCVLNPTPDVTQQETNQGSLAPLPKISGAVSLLNPNEILIELIASQNGNHLVVHGPPLTEKYNLPMRVVAKFIRQILAIPLLHNKRHNQPGVINSYWEHISKLFNLPTHICRACWNFLLENFNHFPQIAPMKDLMRPFTTSLKVWRESTVLFTDFDTHAESNGWWAHLCRLPELVECVGTYPVLYKDMDNNDEASNTDMEHLCVWRTIALRFPSITEIPTIWTAIKNVFCQYMSDIEFGIDNKWHINWWRVFARLKFLVYARYSSNEPYYHIITNKMDEEVERCAMIEMKKRYCKDEPEAESNGAKNLFTDKMISNDRRMTVETVALLTAIEKYPIIYEKGDCLQKYEAWACVAKELQMDVTDCLVAFRHACQKYCTYKRQDNISRCHINMKYYKRFDAIFRTIKTSARNKLNIRTPFELNQSVEKDQDGVTPSTSSTTASASPLTAEDLIFPERYISEIGMSNSESNLVVKNWIYAIGNLPTGCAETIYFKLRDILNNYLPLQTK